MRIVMTPGLCATPYRDTSDAFCQDCFANFLRHGAYPDRACITGVVDDGQDVTTLVLRLGGTEQILTLSDEQRAALAEGGWPGWRAASTPLEGTPGAP